MKPSTAVVATTAVLVVGGGLFAANAAATPAAPEPTATPSVSASVSAGRARVAWFYGGLTDVQRGCLADAKLERPEGRLTDAQRTELSRQVQAALSGCGVSLPARLAERPRLGFAWAALTPEQQQCLADVAVTRPVGRLTPAERDEVRKALQDAVKACGVGR